MDHVSILYDSRRESWLIISLIYRFADADTLILNPAVALSILLPDALVRPSPLILANTDHRGFNAGVMVFRVSVRLASFLMSMIANEAVLFSINRVHPSDQLLFAYTLQESRHVDVTKGFYLIPQRWINSYWIEGDGPALHLHLVNQRKWQENWPQTVIGAGNEVYRAAGDAAGEAVRAALESTDNWKIAKDRASAFWGEAKGGIDGVLFNEI